MTVSEALSTRQILLQRRNQLNELKKEVATRERWYGDKDHVKEPVYDVCEVDKKIVKINIALLGIDKKIKASNAVTNIDMEIDLNDLLSEIPKFFYPNGTPKPAQK